MIGYPETVSTLTPTPVLLALTPENQAAVATFTAHHHTTERLLRDAWAVGADLHDILVLDGTTMT